MGHKKLILIFICLCSLLVYASNLSAAQISISEVENNNERASATTLPLDKLASGTINPLKDIDFYKINVAAAGSLSLSLTNVSEQIEAFVSLYNSEGIRLMTKTADAAGLSINLERMVSEGDYYICVGDTLGKHISLAPYLLKANFNPTISLNCGKTVQGSISVRGERDFYVFSAQANDVVLIRIAETSISSFYPYLELYSPDGTNLASGEQIDKTLPVSGKYTIIVRDLGDYTTGNYCLIFERANNPVSPTISYGQNVSGSITNNERFKFYNFSAQANDVVFIRVTKTSGSLYPYLELYSPDGTNLASGEQIDKTLPLGGKYTIIVRDLANWYPGNFQLIVNRQ